MSFPEEKTFVNTPKGERMMCQAVQNLIDESTLTKLFEYVEHGTMKLAGAAREADLTIDQFRKEMTLKGYTVPERRTSKAVAVP